MLTLLDLDINGGSGKTAQIGQAGTNGPLGEELYTQYLKDLEVKNHCTVVQSSVPTLNRFRDNGRLNTNYSHPWNKTLGYKEQCQAWIKECWSQKATPLFYKLTNPNHQQDPSGTILILDAFNDFIQQQTNSAQYE